MLQAGGVRCWFGDAVLDEQSAGLYLPGKLDKAVCAASDAVNIGRRNRASAAVSHMQRCRCTGGLWQASRAGRACRKGIWEKAMRAVHDAMRSSSVINEGVCLRRITASPAVPCAAACAYHSMSTDKPEQECSCVVSGAAPVSSARRLLARHHSQPCCPLCCRLRKCWTVSIWNARELSCAARCAA